MPTKNYNNIPECPVCRRETLHKIETREYIDTKCSNGCLDIREYKKEVKNAKL